MKQRLSKEHTLGSLGERMNERVPKRSCTAVNAEERNRERERERERERPNNTIQRRKRKIKQMVREEERESIGSVK